MICIGHSTKVDVGAPSALKAKVGLP